MDLNDVDFDENMTVPHPSRHPTTTSAGGLCLDNNNIGANHYNANSFASIMGTIDMHQLNHQHQLHQHQHHQQQQHQQQQQHHHLNNSHLQQQSYLQQQSSAAHNHHHQQQLHQHNHHNHLHHPHHNLHLNQQQQQYLSRQRPYYNTTSASTPAANHYSPLPQNQALNLEHQQHPFNYLSHQQQIPNPQQDPHSHATTLPTLILSDLEYQRHGSVIKERILMLLDSAKNTQEILTNGLHIQEDLIIDNQERSKMIAKKNHYEEIRDKASSERMQKELILFDPAMKKKIHDLKEIRLKFYYDLRRIYEQLREIQQEVLFSYLPLWNQSQQRENNGGVKGESSQVESSRLDQIQEWVELLFDLTWRIRCQLRALSQYVCKMGSFNLDLLNSLGFAINQSLETLILNTFIVEKQPPQVMKTNTRFTSSVRLLIGARVSLNMTHPVKATILSENNARAIIQRHRDIVRASYADYAIPLPPLPRLHQSTPMDDNAVTLPLGANQQQSHNVLAASVSPTYSTSNGASPPQPDLIQTATATATAASAPAVKQQVIPSPPLQSSALNQQQQEQFFLQQQFQATKQQQHVPMDAAYQTQQKGQEATDSASPYRGSKMVNINDFDPSGEILNSSNIMEYQETTRHLVCNFRNMQLKKIKRTEKKGTESVMDEKFVLLFHSEFAIQEPLTTSSDGSNYLTMGGDSQLQVNWLKYCDLSFHLMAFSLPVVVIVHGNQDPHAWATVTWHNAFARRDNILYRVPDKVFWHELGQVLSDKFLANAGKGLNAQNLEYLASKVCRQRVDSASAVVTWNQFAKEPLPERSFTFWEWFHSILKLTRDHLKELWNADRIFGFMDKKGCIDILLGSPFNDPCQLGTFLLRYSETELGGITIAWIANSAQQQQSGDDHYGGRLVQSMRRSPTGTSSGNILMHLLPYVSKDLNTRSLADRIHDLETLVYLYPNLPKDEAFGQWYSRDNPPMSHLEYVRPSLKQTLPKNLGQIKANNSAATSTTTNTSNEFVAITPTTPSSYSQSSPDRAFQIDYTQIDGTV